MTWLGEMDVAALPTDMEPIIGQGFEEGHAYTQIDLGGKFVIEGVAQYFLEGKLEPNYFTCRAVHHILTANQKKPGSYIGFAGADEQGGPIAHVYKYLGRPASTKTED